MKKLITILLLLPFYSIAQKKSQGYAYLQPSFFIAKNFDNKFHLNAGFGVSPSPSIGFGFGFDVFAFKKNQAFVVPKAEVRPFIKGLDEKTSVYLSFQPGYLIYSKKPSNNFIKGGFCFDALGGIISRNSVGGPGVTVNAGYSLISFKVAGQSDLHHGFKIQAGFSF